MKIAAILTLVAPLAFFSFVGWKEPAGQIEKVRSYNDNGLLISIGSAKEIVRTHLDNGYYEDRFWTSVFAEHAILNLAIVFVYDSGNNLIVAYCEGGYGQPLPTPKKYVTVLLSATFPFEGVPQGNSCAMFSHVLSYIGYKSELPPPAPARPPEHNFHFWDETLCR